MIFKKRKRMNEQAFEQKPPADDTTDNLSQEQDNLDALSQGLNTDENMAGTQLLNEELDTNDEQEQLKKELDEVKDKYVRLVAEFENFRRRNAKERMELIQTAGKDVVQSLLVVLDDCERASRMIESATDIEPVKEGVSLVFNKLKNILQQKGLKKMDSKGLEFDPEVHEAITEIPVPEEAMKGKVIDEVEPGYYLNEKLIRHAKVVVGK